MDSLVQLLDAHSLKAVPLEFFRKLLDLRRLREFTDEWCYR